MTEHLDFEQLAQEFDMDVASVAYWTKITRLMEAIRKRDREAAKLEKESAKIRAPRVYPKKVDFATPEIVGKILSKYGSMSTQLLALEIASMMGLDYAAVRRGLMNKAELQIYRVGFDEWKMPENNSGIPKYPLDM
jgi:hypothetical protein